MEAWILILFLRWGYSGGPIIIGSYSSDLACQQALHRTDITYLNSEKNTWSRSVNYDARCVRVQ